MLYFLGSWEYQAWRGGRKGSSAKQVKGWRERKERRRRRRLACVSGGHAIIIVEEEEEVPKQASCLVRTEGRPRRETNA